jgi:hypothetical protein
MFWDNMQNTLLFWDEHSICYFDYYEVYHEICNFCFIIEFHLHLFNYFFVMFFFWLVIS